LPSQPAYPRTCCTCCFRPIHRFTRPHLPPLLPPSTQGYVTYDAKKTGGFTFCHLRFGPHPILSEYEIYESDYTACHHPTYVHTFDVGRTMKPGSIFVLNSPWETLEEIERHVPASLRRQIAERKVGR